MKTRIFAGWLSLNEMPYDHWNGDATGYASIWIDIEDGVVSYVLKHRWAHEPVPGVDVPADGDTIYNLEEFARLFYGKTENEDNPN